MGGLTYTLEAFHLIAYYLPLCPPDETKREREFYRKRNLPNPKDLPLNQSDVDETADKLNEAHLESDYHRQDEQVNVCLECNSSNLAKLQRRFIRCSSQATITHLKKFVAKKVFDGIDKYREVGWRWCGRCNIREI